MPFVSFWSINIFLVTLLMLNNKGLWIRTWFWIGLVSDAAHVSLREPASMESFHGASIQTVKKLRSPSASTRVQDHGELLSARPVSRQPLEVWRTDADEWKCSLVARALLCAYHQSVKNRRHSLASLYFIRHMPLHVYCIHLKQANKCFIK